METKALFLLCFCWKKCPVKTLFFTSLAPLFKLATLGMEKLKYPQFGGKLADYPSWKYDWSQLVHLRMDELTNLLKQREVVPKDAKMVLKNLNTLEEAWEFIDGEFSDQDRLTAESVRYPCFLVLSRDWYCQVQAIASCLARGIYRPRENWSGTKFG